MRRRDFIAARLERRVLQRDAVAGGEPVRIDHVIGVSTVDLDVRRVRRAVAHHVDESSPSVENTAWGGTMMTSFNVSTATRIVAVMPGRSRSSRSSSATLTSKFRGGGHESEVGFRQRADAWRCVLSAPCRASPRGERLPAGRCAGVRARSRRPAGPKSDETSGSSAMLAPGPHAIAFLEILRVHPVARSPVPQDRDDAVARRGDGQRVQLASRLVRDRTAPSLACR